MRFESLACGLLLTGCGLLIDLDPEPDAALVTDAGGVVDAGMTDAGLRPDAALEPDAGPVPVEACNGVDDDGDDRVDEAAIGAPAICPDGAVCVEGACSLETCPPMLPDCDGDGTCDDLASDVANCGACGNSCGSGERCVERACQVVWAGVTAGDAHTCGWTTSGQVYCWGRNESGQLGDGTTTERNEPALTSVSDAQVVSAGGAHTCAIRGGGDILCWGAGMAGQLGTGVEDGSSSPVSIASGDVAVDLSTSAFATLAALADGDLLAWGSNANGALGDGTTLRRLAPVRIPDGAAVEVALGTFHGCFRRRSGEVLCSGNNRGGELGGGTANEMSVTPVVVPALFADQISAGATYTLARVGGEVFCFGANTTSNPCVISGAGAIGPVPMPVTIPRIIDASDVDAGRNHACVVELGQVRCWGDNREGQTGGSLLDDRQNPTLVPGLSDVVHVSAGTAHTCALTSDGEIYCWGQGSEGQLGAGRRDGIVATPQRVLPPGT